MTKTDKKRLAWLLPLAMLLSTWWMFRLNPCLDEDAGNQVRALLPADPEVVENPYGIEACDHWPTVSDHWITLLSLVFITALVGFFAARCEQRPVRQASLIMFAGLAPVEVFSNLVYLPSLVEYAEFEGPMPMLTELGVGLAVMLFASALSAFTAWLRLKISRTRG